MNLWRYFPESLLEIAGILLLPYLAIPFYLYIFYPLIKQVDERKYLAIFLLLSVIASSIMLFSIGPHIGKVIPPLALILVLAMPTLMLINKLYTKVYHSALLWFFVMLAGWLHSLSWGVWLFALGGS